MDRKINIFKYLMLCIACVFIFLATINISYPQENLSLTGIIRAVNPQTGIVRIQVTSEQCKGLWNFKFPEYAKDDLDNSIVGKRLQFTIDSPICDPKRLHTIVLER